MSQCTSKKSGWKITITVEALTFWKSYFQENPNCIEWPHNGLEVSSQTIYCYGG